MTITPSAFPENNPADYKASIFVRHGIDVDAPGSWRQLAAMESREMLKRLRAAHTYSAPVSPPDIMKILERGEATADDIAVRLDIARDTASHHLLRLMRAGLVKADKVMRVRIYSIAEGAAE